MLTAPASRISTPPPPLTSNFLLSSSSNRRRFTSLPLSLPECEPAGEPGVPSIDGVLVKGGAPVGDPGEAGAQLGLLGGDLNGSSSSLVLIKSRGLASSEPLSSWSLSCSLRLWIQELSLLSRCSASRCCWRTSSANRLAEY